MRWNARARKQKPPSNAKRRRRWESRSRDFALPEGLVAILGPHLQEGRDALYQKALHDRPKVYNCGQWNALGAGFRKVPNTWQLPADLGTNWNVASSR